MTTLAGTRVGTLTEILATRVKMEFQHRVDFTPYNYPYDKHLEIIEWCKKNCQGVWRAETTLALYFQFDNDRDATMFMLRWR